VGRARAQEVILLQASPLLGVAFAGGLTASWRPPALLLGSVLLTAHVFAFNDWAGRRRDLADPRRDVFSRHGIGSGAVAALAILLLSAALLALAAVGLATAVVGVAIAGLGVVYSGGGESGKGVPVFASVLHVLGGALHFLLGYSVGGTVDLRGVAIATFFGLVFAGGHLNQEVRDHDVDRANGIRTSAVAFGPRRALLASLAAFSTAYAVLAALALADVVPRPLLWAAVALWPLHLAFSAQALRAVPTVERARWLQLRYRLLLALVGLAMALSLMAGSRQPAGEPARAVASPAPSGIAV
jgi:4-hydroxybenzoate polyprenyltransferase